MKKFVLFFLLLGIFSACTEQTDNPKHSQKREQPPNKEAEAEQESLTLITPEEVQPSFSAPRHSSSRQPAYTQQERDIKQVFAEQAPRSQDFAFDPNFPEVISCQGGTRINVPAEAFVFEDGTPVTTPVTLKVREFYRKSDYLLAGLGTHSGDQMLESGGMLHLEARSEGRKLRVADGKSLEIAMPRENTRVSSGEGMQVFTSDNPEHTPPTDWSPTNDTMSFEPVRPEPPTLLAHKGGAKAGEKAQYFRGEWELPQYHLELVKFKAESWARGISKLPRTKPKYKNALTPPAQNFEQLEFECDTTALPEIPMRYMKNDREFVVQEHGHSDRFYQYGNPEFVRLDTVQIAVEVWGKPYYTGPEDQRVKKWNIYTRTLEVLSGYDKQQTDLPVERLGVDINGSFFVDFQSFPVRRVQTGVRNLGYNTSFSSKFNSQSDPKLAQFIRKMGIDWQRHYRWQGKRPGSIQLSGESDRAIMVFSAIVRTVKYPAKVKVVDYRGYYHYLKTQQDAEIDEIVLRYGNGKYESRRIRRNSEIKLDLVYNRGRTFTDVYLASVRRLGWINCDRFLQIPREQRTLLFVEAEAPVNMVFKDINSILSGTRRKRNGKTAYTFSGVPKGRPVTLFSVKKQDGEILLAIRHTQTGESQEPLVYHKVTENELLMHVQGLSQEGRDLASR